MAIYANSYGATQFDDYSLQYLVTRIHSWSKSAE